MTLAIDSNDTDACTKLAALRESYEFEAKEAQGKDGMGAVPRALWSSYSAMANSDGGYILLGAKEEDDGSLTFTGIGDTEKVIDDFWNSANNLEIISTNILKQDSVKTIECNGAKLILIRVDRASRKEKPVHLGKNPYGNTYKRLNKGDYRCNKDEVNRMISEASTDARDSNIMEGFTLEKDIEHTSLNAFRNDFSSSKPRHPYLALDDKELLRKLGGWRTDRRTGDEGLTLAGLLMFGKWESIREAMSYYSVDYQDHTRLLEGQRWSDRVVPDGTWAGNLYEFYLKVYSKLVSDLPVPFQIVDGAKRVDETDMHVAIREALINTLVHADYSLTTGIVISKKPNGFLFRNPGLSRIPIEQIYEGGVSDCRNPSLQIMFQMVGGAEKAGSGFPKITHAWAKQHWRRPVFTEKSAPEMVELELLTISLYPDWVTQKLEELFGDKLKELSTQEMAILATAAYEEATQKKRVTNQRLQALLDLHPTDITKLLSSLVERGMLKRQRTSRWSEYTIAAEDADATDVPEPVDVIPEHQDFLFPDLVDKTHTENPATSSKNSTSQTVKVSAPQAVKLSSCQALKLSSSQAVKPSNSQDPDAGGLVETSAIALNHIAQKLLKLCSTPRSANEIARDLGLNLTYVRQKYTSRLIKLGFLKYVGPANSPNVKYQTTESGLQFISKIEAK